jgi:hypothetical protein
MPWKRVYRATVWQRRLLSFSYAGFQQTWHNILKVHFSVILDTAIVLSVFKHRVRKLCLVPSYV